MEVVLSTSFSCSRRGSYGVQFVDRNWQTIAICLHGNSDRDLRNTDQGPSCLPLDRRICKVEVIFLTIAVIWLLPDWNWDRIDQRDQSFRSEAEVPTYTTRYTREMNKAAMDAAARFPDPQSCLVDGKENPQSPKSLRIDWTKVRQSSEAEVCIFRVLSALGGIKSSRILWKRKDFRCDQTVLALKILMWNDVTVHCAFRRHGQFATTGQSFPHAVSWTE